MMPELNCEYVTIFDESVPDLIPASSQVRSGPD
jgi:hypothetical protein